MRIRNYHLPREHGPPPGTTFFNLTINNPVIKFNTMNKIILLIFLAVGLTSFAQTRTTSYDFPVKPGTSEWKKFQSRSEMAEAMQIPPAILKDLTTGALAKTCLSFPMFKDLYFFNDPQTGFNALKQSFNGFGELLNRSDAGTELLELYKQMNPANFKSKWNDTLKGDFTFQFVQIEMLLAQEQIISMLHADTRNELIKEAAQKYQGKKASDIFNGFALGPSVLVIGRILDREGKLQSLKAKTSASGVENFLSTGITDDPKILEQIWVLSKN